MQVYNEKDQQMGLKDTKNYAAWRGKDHEDMTREDVRNVL